MSSEHFNLFGRFHLIDYFHPMAKKLRGSFSIDSDLLARARNTVVALSGPPEQLTLTALVERGLETEIARLEKSYNKGKPFPPMEGRVRTGRPMGS